ncbi:MAG: ATP F0F1 synthase subunit beta [Cyanobacteria bacterium P01_G01_bin.19]
MLIDPFTIIAQIVNFLILVALLKRFLYKPITQAMEARSQRIERQLASAAGMEKDAQAEKELYLQKRKELEAHKQEWLTQAVRDVESKKEELTQTAILDVEQMRSQWYRDFERDRQQLNHKIRDDLTKQITFTARKALVDLAKASLETEIVDTFIERLYHLNSLQSEIISSAPIPKDRHLVTIHSAFSIGEEQKARLVTAIREQIAAEAEVEFKIDTNFICGIELRDRGYKIAWNLEHYLTELEADTAKVLTKNSQLAG